MAAKIVSMTPERRIAENEALAHWAVQKWAHLIESSPDYEDAVQEARQAMYRAAVTYDETRGITFSTLACICIRNQLSHWTTKHRKHGFGHVGDLHVGAPVQWVAPSDEDQPAHEQLGHKEQEDEWSTLATKEQVHRALAWLYRENPLAAKAIYGLYFQSLRYSDIAERMGISKSMASELARRGRDMMLNWLREDTPDDHPAEPPSEKAAEKPKKAKKKAIKK